MATGSDHCGVVGYNMQAAVDTKHHIVVANVVTIDAPQALMLTDEPKANVERYDALRKASETRHAS